VKVSAGSAKGSGGFVKVSEGSVKGSGGFVKVSAGSVKGSGGVVHVLQPAPKDLSTPYQHHSTIQHTHSNK